MDKHSLYGLLIITAIVIGFSLYNNKRAQEYLKTHPIEQTAVSVQEQDSGNIVVREAQEDGSVPDSVRIQSVLNYYGQELMSAQQAEPQEIIVENDLAVIKFSTRGAMISDVELKDYRKYDGSPLKMFADGTNDFNLQFYYRRSSEIQINTRDYTFSLVSRDVDQDGTTRLVMRLPLAQDEWMDCVWSVPRDSYMIGYDLEFNGVSASMASDTEILAQWSNTSLQNEKGYKNENTYTTLSYYFPGAKKLSDLGVAEVKRGGGSKERQLSSKVAWFAFKQQFFSSVLLADEPFQNAEFAYRTHAEGSGLMKDFSAEVSVPYSSSTGTYGFDFFFGPNKFSLLNSFTSEDGDNLQLGKLVPLGGWLIRWCNRWIVIPVFDFLSSFIGSYGLIILLLTLFIKLLIFPLTYKSYLSSAKMRVLAPELQQIAEKYPDENDALKKQQAQMELYKQCGVSPMGGCLPVLIQFPILVAMFRFFPSSIELRGESFLWAKDLSTYDSVLNLPFSIPWYGDHVSLFALMMVVVMYFYSKMTYEQSSAQGTQQMPGMKFMMVYMMPVMMLLWFNNYASGLCYYYFLSQIVTIIQYSIFRFGINEEKLHQKLISNKKTVTKSKWQIRLEEAQKAQQQMQKQQSQRRR